MGRLRARWRALPSRARWATAVWVAGFAEGTGAHIGYWAGGLHYFRGDPVVIQVLFQALVVFDPLAAVLAVRLRPAAVPLGVAIMVCDAGAVWWLSAGDVWRHPEAYLRPYGLPAITAFGVFVVLTARPLRRLFTAAGQVTADRLTADQLTTDPA